LAGKLTAEDRLDILQLIHNYAWALDTGDVDRFVGQFADDAVLVWDAFEQPEEWRGHAELRAFAEDFRDLPSTAGRQHHVSNVVIEGEGERAQATAYVAVMLRQESEPCPVTVLGWYDDEFVRCAEGWKITRHVIRDWAGPVLHRLAGQTGERVGRERPAVLAGLGRRGQ
jgi:ketosteroid isomerase-like protein